MEGIPYYQLEIVLKTAGPISVNGFWGAHLRSALGISLRESCCPFPGASCQSCLLRFDCAFSTAWFTFVQPGEEPSPVPPGVTTNHAHPFVIHPSKNTPDLLPANRLFKFKLVLLGEHTRKLAFWIVALKRVAERGFGRGTKPLTLMKVQVLRKKRSTPIYNSSSDVVRYPGAPDSMDLHKLSIEEDMRTRHSIKLGFYTPVHLRVKGEEAVLPNAKLLWNSLVRRIQGVATATGFEPPKPWGFECYSTDNVGTWTHVYQERWSASQRQKIPATGYMGEITLKGIPASHILWWNAGQLLSVGKMSSLGLGSFEIEPVD